MEWSTRSTFALRECSAQPALPRTADVRPVIRFHGTFAGLLQKTLHELSLDQKGSAMLSRIARFAGNFLQREDGPTAVEYAVMLALIIVVCIGAITMVGQNANTTFGTVSGAVGSAS